MFWKMYDVLVFIVSILQVYNILEMTFFIKYKTNKNIKDQTVKENRLEKSEIYHFMLVVLSGIIFTFFLFLIIWTKIASSEIIFIIYLPFVLEYVFANSDIISEMITKDEIKEKVSIKTINQIILFCMGIMLLTIIFPFERTVLWVRGHIVPGIWNEIIVSLTMLIYLFFVFFVGFIYLTLPVKHVRLLFIRIRTIMQKDKRNYEPISFIEKNILGKYLIRAFGSTRRVVLKIVIVIVFPVVFLIDLLVYIFLFFLYLDEMIVKVLKMGIFWIAKQVSFFVKKMYMLSIDKIVAYAFRLAFIFSDMAVVIYLRIKNPYLFSVQFLTMLEFVSSVIVIPMLFEWFYSVKRTKKVD